MARGRVMKPWYQSKTLTILVVLWALFTACLGIMIVVIFVQPHWMSGKNPTSTSSTNVNFGLYRNCSDNLNDCSGSLNEFNNIYSVAWQACTVFVALSFTSTFISVAMMLLYWLCCFESSGIGFRSSSGLQAFAGMYYFHWLFLGSCYFWTLHRSLCDILNLFKIFRCKIVFCLHDGFAFRLNKVSWSSTS